MKQQLYFHLFFIILGFTVVGFDRIEEISTLDKNLIYAAVYTEQDPRYTSDFEIQLIVECIIYKKHKYMKESSFADYFFKYPDHFQGLRDIEKFNDANSRDVTTNKTILANRKRLTKIKKIVDDRIKLGVARPIEYYHHSYTKNIKFGDGTTKKLNTKHIKYVECKVEKGTHIKHTNNLYHDFFEVKSPSAEYYRYRDILKTIY